MTDAHELLTTVEASAILRRPARTLIQWRYNGTGPGYLKQGRLIYYRRSEIERWLAANSVATRPA